MDDGERRACHVRARQEGRLPASPTRIGKGILGMAMNGVFEVAVVLLLAGVATAQTNAVRVVDADGAALEGVPVTFVADDDACAARAAQTAPVVGREPAGHGLFATGVTDRRGWVEVPQREWRPFVTAVAIVRGLGAEVQLRLNEPVAETTMRLRPLRMVLVRSADGHALPRADVRFASISRDTGEAVRLGNWIGTSDADGVAVVPEFSIDDGHGAVCPGVVWTGASRRLVFATFDPGGAVPTLVLPPLCSLAFEDPWVRGGDGEPVTVSSLDQRAFGTRVVGRRVTNLGYVEADSIVHLVVDERRPWGAHRTQRVIRTPGEGASLTVRGGSEPPQEIALDGRVDSRAEAGQVTRVVAEFVDADWLEEKAGEATVNADGTFTVALTTYGDPIGRDVRFHFGTSTQPGALDSVFRPARTRVLRPQSGGAYFVGELPLIQGEPWARGHVLDVAGRPVRGGMMWLEGACCDPGPPVDPGLPRAVPIDTQGRFELRGVRPVGPFLVISDGWRVLLDPGSEADRSGGLWTRSTAGSDVTVAARSGGLWTLSGTGSDVTVMVRASANLSGPDVVPDTISPTFEAIPWVEDAAFRGVAVPHAEAIGDYVGSDGAGRGMWSAEMNLPPGRWSIVMRVDGSAAPLAEGGPIDLTPGDIGAAPRWIELTTTNNAAIRQTWQMFTDRDGKPCRGADSWIRPRGGRWESFGVHSEWVMFELLDEPVDLMVRAPGFEPTVTKACPGLTRIVMGSVPEATATVLVPELPAVLGRGIDWRVRVQRVVPARGGPDEWVPTIPFDRSHPLTTVPWRESFTLPEPGEYRVSLYGDDLCYGAATTLILAAHPPSYVTLALDPAAEGMRILTQAIVEPLDSESP